MMVCARGASVPTPSLRRPCLLLLVWALSSSTSRCLSAAFKPTTVAHSLHPLLRRCRGARKSTPFGVTHLVPRPSRFRSIGRLSASAGDDNGGGSDGGGHWDGNVAANSSQIRGCTIERVADSLTTWTITIDGVEADLGKFSQVIYRKITNDAKRERFQGFRPGTIPPHLEPTYRAFAMDEAAREATLEAMEQNNIRPFESARSDLIIENVSVPPPEKKGGRKKKKKKKGNKKEGAAAPAEETPAPVWRTFDNMKGAIDAGWKPGQSFSFVAKNVKGQEVKLGASKGGSSIGNQGSALDLNRIAADAARNAAAGAGEK